LPKGGLNILEVKLLKVFEIKNLEETIELGKLISEKINVENILCLTGDLGAGKTTLSKSIIYNLGITEDVTSPTYTIVNEYHDGLTVFHFDVYRINNSEEMLDIGFDDYLDQEAVIIIEWADKIKDIIPLDAIWIDIKYTDEIGNRIISIDGLNWGE